MTSKSGFKLAAPAIRIAPSLLAADFSKLREQVALIEHGGADLLHLDVMDGHFVPNISFGPGVISNLRPHSNLFFDAHLMIAEPQRYTEAFVKAGCDHITFHIEVTPSPGQVIEHIRSFGVSAGICINPSTPVSQIEPVLGEVDLVLVMSVWPGFGGQAFMPEVLTKVEALQGLLGDHQRLQIDGGIDPETVVLAAEAGADTMVTGSAVFGAADPVQAMQDIRAKAQAASVKKARCTKRTS